MAYEKLLERFVKLCRDAFGTQLTGVYLHGSLAMGCFHPKKSDIDLLVVVESAPDEESKRAFLQGVLTLNAQAPEKGLELSVVERQYIKPFVYPTPYAFHFSNAHRALAENPAAYLETLQGTDKDLAAHVTILNHYGVTLFGAPVNEVFGAVAARDYIDSIWYDVKNAPTDIAENPVYVTLNLCRVLAYVLEKRVLSKQRGGAWGMENVPEGYRTLVQEALLCYQNGTNMCPDEQSARAFALEMLDRIRAAMARQA